MIADAHDPPCVPLAAVRRDPSSVTVTARIATAQRAMRRLVLSGIATRLYRELGTIRAVATRMGRGEEYMRDLLVEAGTHVPQRRTAAAPRGRR